MPKKGEKSSKYEAAARSRELENENGRHDGAFDEVSRASPAQVEEPAETGNEDRARPGENPAHISEEHDEASRSLITAERTAGAREEAKREETIRPKFGRLETSLHSASVPSDESSDTMDWQEQIWGKATEARRKAEMASKA